MVYYPNLLKNKTSYGDREPASPKGKIKKILLLLVVIIIISAGFFLYRTNSIIKKISGAGGSIMENVNHFIPLLGSKDILRGEEDKRINVILLGMRGADDPHGGLLTDSIMVVSVRLENQDCSGVDCLSKNKELIPEKIALISIPRDLFVEIPGHGGLYKLNEAYHLGGKDTKDGGGLELVKETVSEIIGIPIHYAISVDFKGFKEIIEQLDGIEVDVPRDFYDPNYDGGIYVKAGKQFMNAETALKYAQARLTSNDFDRAKRQQLILVGIRNKAMSKNIITNPVKALSVLDSLGKHFRSDMQLWEIKRFMELSKGMNDDSKTIHKVFDTSPEGLLYSSHVNGAYALRPIDDNFDKIKEVVNNIFNQ